MNIYHVKEQCCACAACINICPQHCISFVQDQYGMIHSSVDENRCIHCGLCVKVCPYYEKGELKHPIQCLAAYRKSTKEMMDCASGGIAYSLYKKFISDGFYVAGVLFNQDYKAVFKITNKKEDIYRFQGSKYVQADISELYKDLEILLQNGKKILIIALPCQIAAIKNFISNKRLSVTQIVFVDLLCHGVSPGKYLDEELTYLVQKYKWKTIKKISFRSNYKYRDFNLTIFAETIKRRKRVYCASSNVDEYFWGFLSGVSLCESCYDCAFSKVDRISDITIGDYINIGTNARYPQYNGKKKNVSIILCNTEKGMDVIYSLGKELNIFERPLEEAVDQCSALNEPCAQPEFRKKFLDRYLEGGYIYAVHKTFGRINRNWLTTLKQSFKQQYILNPLFRKLVDTLQGFWKDII